MKTNTLVGRTCEYGSNSKSLVIFPPHFEINTEFSDDRIDAEVFKRPAKQLYFYVEFNNPELHDTEEETILQLTFYLPDSIPVDLFGEFVIEDSGFSIMEIMLDRITFDIADYLTNQSYDREPYLDFDELYNDWNELVHRLVLSEVEKLLQNSNTHKTKE
jgi:hypothetical protein